MIKIISLLPGRDIEKIEFSVIKNAILAYIEPRDRRLIADRTNFLNISQGSAENELDFLTRINSIAINYKWDELKHEQPSDELVKLKFISGLFDQNL